MVEPQGWRTAPRASVSTAVFEQLAEAILSGALAPGDSLPPERELGERFGVSRMLVRQGVHRLAEAGLVQVRQGGATRVLDPALLGDLRIIELTYRLGADERPAFKALAAHVLEKQYTQGLSLIDCFARNASPAARAALTRVAADEGSVLERYEQAFWEAVAAGGGNRILVAEVRWWYHVLAKRPRPRRRSASDVRAFYRELARRLREPRAAGADDAITYYRATLGEERS